MLPRHARSLLVAGLALVTIGVAVLAFAPTNQFGWFAYAPPPPGNAFTPGVVLGATHLWGAAVGAVGLVATGWAAGYLAGRRAPRP